MTSVTQAGFPLFIVGAPRSGTTLVYSILLASGAFPLYRAESRVFECSSRYGLLRRRRNFERFLHDYLQSRQFARSGLDPTRFAEQALSTCDSYADVLTLLMTTMAKEQGKERWMEKTPNHILHMAALRSHFPSARFIHVIRDGRDVALSHVKLGWTRQFSSDTQAQLVWGVKIWESLVTMARREGRAGSDTSRYLELRYERLITNFDESLPELESFAQVQLPAASVLNAGIGALAQANTAYEDDISGVSDKPLERWKVHASVEEIAAMEYAVGATLLEFGYELHASAIRPPVRGSVRAHAKIALPLLRVKRFLNARTPVGRFGRKPLEIGLE